MTPLWEGDPHPGDGAQDAQGTQDSADAPSDAPPERRVVTAEHAATRPLPVHLAQHVDPYQWSHALAYLERGWKIFLLPGGEAKRPATNCPECREAGADHDREACDCLLCHGFYAATGDPERLAAMWERVPGASMALRTGAASGICAIDAEGHADREGDTTGVEVLDSWDQWVPEIPLTDTLRALTPSGGVHLLYATGQDDHVRSAARVLPGVDVRGRGGYIVLPPGRRGERSWIGGFREPAAPDPALLAWMRAARGGRGRTMADGIEGAGPAESRMRERWNGYDFDRMVREGAPQGVQEQFLNDLLFRLVAHNGTTDADELYARVWPMVTSWDQDPANPWTAFQVSRKIAYVLDTVDPAPPLPAWTPRREGAAEVTATWNGAPRSIAVVLPTPASVLALPDAVHAPDGASGTTGTTGADTAPGPDATVISVDFGGSRDGDGDGDGDGSGRVGYGGPTGDGVPGTEGMHDTGNANRLVRLHGHEMRWVEDEGVWLIWDGVRWQRDRVRTVEGWTVDVMTDLARHARQVGGEEAQVWVRHMRASYSAGRRSAMLLNAQRIPGVTVTSEMLDTDPWVLVVRNGVLDLRTGRLNPGRRDDLHTRSAAVAHDPQARCPRWEAHVDLVTQGDPEKAAYLQRLAGYSLTGLTSEQAFFSLEGSGDNGKNAFIEPLMLIMGEYADTADSKLVTYGDKTHASIVASLVGQRLIFVDEIPAGRQMDVERVKSLTGSKRMKAQFMARDWFTFTPQLKLWIAGNAQPPVKDTSDGIWRRMHRIVFGAKVPAEAKVKDFSQVLFQEEGPGILNWCLEGLAQWVATGRLGMPEDVRESVQELKDDSDHVAAFFADCCDVTGRAATRNGPFGFSGEWEGDWVPNGRLMAVYAAWCDTQGVKPRERFNAVHLGRRAVGLGMTRYRDRRDGDLGRGLEGVKLSVSAVSLWGSVL